MSSYGMKKAINDGDDDFDGRRTLEVRVGELEHVCNNLELMSNQVRNILFGTFVPVGPDKDSMLDEVPSIKTTVDDALDHADRATETLMGILEGLTNKNITLKSLK